MPTHADKIRDNGPQVSSGPFTQNQNREVVNFQLVSNRPEVHARKQLETIIGESQQHLQLKALKNMAASSSHMQMVTQLQTLQANANRNVQRVKANNTGLPDNLKSGIENLSGYSMDDVKVHYNSPQPAELHAHAYAQGTDIHIAPGQERHLPHEAWHVVQQKQGRVQPTRQMKGNVNVNDDAGLEQEADVMGVRALQARAVSPSPFNIAKQFSSFQTIQRKPLKTTVTGITHLVIAKGNSIYEGTEYEKEASYGMSVEIETTEKLRSRRGPNHVETFAATDKTAPHLYRWFRVKKFDGRAVPENTYIRDDTFVSAPEDLGGRQSVINPLLHRERQSKEGTSPLRKHYPPASFPRLYKTGMINRFEAIQMLLRNRGAAHTALLHLEQAARIYLKDKSAVKPTEALNLALHAMEKKWMNRRFFDLREKEVKKTPSTKKKSKPNAERTVIVQNSGPIEFQKQFLEGVVQNVVPFKDVGAPLTHGEYAHRIQWYIIAFYYLENWGKAGLQQLHQEAGKMEYLKQLKTPRIKQDNFRSLWDYVNDLRRTEAEEVGADSEQAYMASPVMVTSDLLGYTGVTKNMKPGQLAKYFPVVAHAVANRKRKRVLEARKGERGKYPEQLNDDTGWQEREAWLMKTFPEHFKKLVVSEL